jgi:predicted dehydrogenase
MINTAIVGLGYWGPNIVRNLDLISNVKVVVDVDDSKFSVFKEKYPNIIFTQDYNEVHKHNIDAVAIVTPPSTHYSVAKQFSQYHLFIEKPLTHTLEQAKKLLQIENKQKRNCVGHVFLFSPEINKLKEYINDGTTGNIQAINITRLNFGKYQACGVESDLLPHDLSILNYLIDGDLMVKSASYGNLDNVNISGCAVLKKNDIECVVSSSWAHTSKIRRVSVIGDNGIFEYDMSVPNIISVYNNSNLRKNALGPLQKIEVSYADEPLLAELKYWISLIEDPLKKQELISFRDGYEVVKLIENIKGM